MKNVNTYNILQAKLKLSHNAAAAWSLSWLKVWLVLAPSWFQNLS